VDDGRVTSGEVEGVGAGRVVKHVKTDVGARRIRWVEKFRKAVRAGDLVKENGPKMSAISYSAAVTFRQIIIMSSGAYSSFLSHRSQR
jgi:hypothetical protein